MSVDAHAYREVIGRFTTGVTVLTIEVGDVACGMTANAVASVSLDPVLLLCCVARAATAHAFFERGETFAVNILADDQRDLSVLFAEHGMPALPLGGVAQRKSSRGTPLLEGTLAFAECRIQERIGAGDHTIVLGEVLDAGVTRPDGEPLLFYAGRYRRIEGEPGRAGRTLTAPGSATRRSRTRGSSR